jgi:hypothetical protein
MHNFNKEINIIAGADFSTDYKSAVAGYPKLCWRGFAIRAKNVYTDTISN